MLNKKIFQFCSVNTKLFFIFIILFACIFSLLVSLPIAFFKPHERQSPGVNTSLQSIILLKDQGWLLINNSVRILANPKSTVIDIPNQSKKYLQEIRSAKEKLSNNEVKAAVDKLDNIVQDYMASHLKAASYVAESQSIYSKDIAPKFSVTRKMLHILASSADKYGQLFVFAKLNAILNKVLELQVLTENYIHDSDENVMLKINHSFAEITNEMNSFKNSAGKNIESPLEQVQNMLDIMHEKIQLTGSLNSKYHEIITNHILKSEELVIKSLNEIEEKTLANDSSSMISPLKLFQNDYYIFTYISLIALVLYVSFSLMFYKDIMVPLLNIARSVEDLAKGQSRSNNSLRSRYDEINFAQEAIRTLQDKVKNNVVTRNNVTLLASRVEHHKNVTEINRIKEDIQSVIKSVHAYTTLSGEIERNITSIKKGVIQNINRTDDIDHVIDSLSKEDNVTILFELIYNIAKKLQMLTFNFNVNDSFEGNGINTISGGKQDIKELLTQTVETAEVLAIQINNMREARNELIKFVNPVKSSMTEIHGIFNSISDKILNQEILTEDIFTKMNSLNEMIQNIIKLTTEEYVLDTNVISPPTEKEKEIIELVEE